MKNKGFFSFLKSMGNAPEEASAVAVSSESKPIVGKIVSALGEEATDIVTSEILSFAHDNLVHLLAECHFKARVKVEKKGGDMVHMEISTGEDNGRIIGKDGGTLDAMQVLIKAFIFKKFGLPVKVLVDVGRYRRNRIESATAKALTVARQLNDENPKRELGPMGAAERRAVHMIFKEHQSVKSYSIGEGSERRVVLERR